MEMIPDRARILGQSIFDVVTFVLVLSQVTAPNLAVVLGWDYDSRRPGRATGRPAARAASYIRPS